MAAQPQLIPAPRLSSRTRLVFRNRGGTTYLAEERVEAPQKILRPFALDDGRVVLQIIQSTPGLFAGDRFTVEVVAERGARVVLLQPAATKLHTMGAAAHAEQSVSVRVEAEASVEFYPNLFIPYPDADFRQTVAVDLDPLARFAYLESWAVGRVERGEEFLFRRLSSRFSVGQGGQALYRDALELDPSAANPAVLDGRRYVVSGFWAGLPTDSFSEGEAPTRDRLEAAGPAALGGHYFRGLYAESRDWQQAVARVHEAAEQAWQHTPVAAARFCC